MKITFKKTKQSKRRNTSKSGTSTNESAPTIKIDADTNCSDFFTQNATFEQHYDAQTKYKEKYLATLMAFDTYLIDITPNAKAKILSAAFARHDKQLIDHVLYHHKQFGFTDVLKAVTLLDSKRERKALEKKMARIEKCGSVMKPKKAARCKVDLNNLKKQIPKFGSVSGALARQLKKWVRTFKTTELEFYALQMPTEPWKKLADIIHLNPTKDFPNAPWFLPYCFGGELPANSMVQKCKSMTTENVNELIKEFPELPYSFVKTFKNGLNDESKKIIVNHTDLDTILWFYEDLDCPGVDDIIKSQLEKGEKVDLQYGKLMERLLILKDKKKTALLSLIVPSAETRLANFKSTLPGPVAVIGDASSSMSVAIKTATIISSLLTAICNAKLSFFHTQNFEAKVEPKNIEDVLKLASTTRASGATAPAASLVPYMDKKSIVKTFIIVTDEEENTDARTKDGKNWRFYELFMEYRKQVYPATLIFISFLRSQHSVGQMYKEFVNDKVPDVMQFKFCGDRPDLTKLDSILGTLCSKSSQSFDGFVENLESELRSKVVSEALDELKVKGEDEPEKVFNPTETVVSTETIKINMY